MRGTDSIRIISQEEEILFFSNLYIYSILLHTMTNFILTWSRVKYKLYIIVVFKHVNIQTYKHTTYQQVDFINTYIIYLYF